MLYFSYIYKYILYDARSSATARHCRIGSAERESIELPASYLATSCATVH